MFWSFNNWLWLNFATLAYTLSPLPPSLLQTLNTTQDSTLRKANFEKSSSLTATAVDGLLCSKRYGENIPVDSCHNALRKIPLNVHPRTYIHRHKGFRPTSPRFVPLPIRYLSDDGLCAIDVILEPVR